MRWLSVNHPVARKAYFSWKNWGHRTVQAGFSCVSANSAARFRRPGDGPGAVG
jgi:hypothetical protein